MGECHLQGELRKQLPVQLQGESVKMLLGSGPCWGGFGTDLALPGAPPLVPQWEGKVTLLLTDVHGRYGRLSGQDIRWALHLHSFV